MIPLGVLASARVAAGGGSLVGTYIGSVASPANAANATATIAGVPIGTASASRTVVIALGQGNDNTTLPAITAVTIGGVPATIHAQANPGRGHGVLASAQVPTGTTADVTFTNNGYSSISSRCLVWTIDGTIGTVDAASDPTTPVLTAAVTAAAGGFIVAASWYRYHDNAHSWAEVTECQSTGGVQLIAGAQASPTTGGDVAVGITWPATANGYLMAAAFSPA